MKSPIVSKTAKDSMDHFNNTAVDIERVSVHYRIRRDRPTSLKEYAIRLAKRSLDTEYVKAINDVSLQIRKGKVFAIIGRNGAGKTTLLRVISGIIRPKQGRVRVWGKVVSLLGVGAGFHFELTGRENAFLYSAILGRSQAKTEELYPRIVEFAELADFIDSPLRVYSSGMIARLGFAVAMVEQPEVLLVDEVLRVGDEQFQAKCQARFEEFTASGTTVILATHAMSAVRTMCDQAVWLQDGVIEAFGAADDVAGKYQESLKEGKERQAIRP